MLSRDAWSRIEELFHAALARSGDDREALLAAECGDDEELRSEVESLVAAHEESEGSGSFSESAASELAAEMVSDSEAPPASESPSTGSTTGVAARPDQIGPYRLLETLGEGGMGTVYLAEQSEPLPRRVALKLMRWGGAHEETVRRFELEREALARMSHPAIAQVLDAGATEHGQPYFVLEYIPGESITDFCDQRGLGLRERLELFCSVCDGVRHAHEKGVIHRDLKPSNILVREEKGLALAKIIDFGIAKALEPWSEKAASATATRWRMGSPAYMSPEAIEAGGAVDTRSDVYSLGIVLYELLVGVRHLDLSPLSDEGLRDALAGDPQPPSQRLRGLPAEERQEIARGRGLDERKLTKRLRGELDWIALRAVEREPSRRYASPAELGADIERYLAHESVAARPPSFVYRARKMVRRHAAAFTAASLVAAALVAGIVSTTLQARRARNEAVAARQVSDYLVELFEVSDPYQATESVTARELLERGRERIERELGEQPEIRARLLRTIGTVYRHLALLDEAESLLVEALELSRQVHGDRHLEVAESLEQLAKLMQDRGRWELAEEHLRKALEIRERRLGESAPEVAAALDELSYTVRRRGNFDEAETLVRRALRIYEEEGRDLNSAELATATDNLASLLSETGDWAGAERLLREALAMRRRLHPEGHIQVVNSLNHLSDVLRRRESYEEAETLMRESLAMSRQLFGQEHPTVAAALDRLASVFHQQGERDQAEPLMRQALVIRQRFLGDDHPEVSESLNNLAVVLRHQGELEEAEGLLRRSIAIDREHLGPNHHYVGDSLVNLAMLVRDRHGPADAEPIFREGLEVYAVAYPDGFWVTALAGCRLGRCLVPLEKYAEAEALLEEGLELLRRDRGESSPHTEVCAQGLVELYQAWGKPELAAAVPRKTP